MNWIPSHDEFGILPTVISTFIVGAGALLISAAIGIPAAIYLAEFSPPSLRNVLKPCIEMLVGIPSVVLGFFGLFVIVVLLREHGLGSGECIFAAWLVLAVMTFPHVVSISDDAILAVPRSLREASLALGATKLQTIREVVLRNAFPGMITGVLLGLGKALGETAVVLLTAGSGLESFLPRSIFDPVGSLPVYIYMVSTQGRHSSTAFSKASGASFVLLTMFLIVTVSALILRNRYIRKIR